MRKVMRTSMGFRSTGLLCSRADARQKKVMRTALMVIFRKTFVKIMCDMIFKGAPLGALGESDKSGGLGKAASGFVASKWETVDPEEVKKGVVTTSKWETEEKDELVKARKALMGSVASKWDDREEDIDGVPMGGDSDSGEVC